MLLRLSMLPGLALLLWAAPRSPASGADGAVALWICVLNPLVIVHLMGGVQRDADGRDDDGRDRVDVGRASGAGTALVAVAVAVKATAVLALPFLVWVGCATCGFPRAGRRPRPVPAFLTAAAGVGGDLRRGVRGAVPALADVGLGWLTALAGR